MIADFTTLSDVSPSLWLPARVGPHLSGAPHSREKRRTYDIFFLPCCRHMSVLKSFVLVPKIDEIVEVIQVVQTCPSGTYSIQGSSFSVFFLCRLMVRKGWTKIEVPEGGTQIIRGPRPPSAKWQP